MPISRPETRPLESHVNPDSPPPILRFEVLSVGTQGLVWSARRLKAISGGGTAQTGTQVNIHRTAGAVDLNIGDKVWCIWKRDSKRFEVLTSAAGTGVDVVRFELSQDYSQNSTVPMDAKIVQWNGTIYDNTGANIWVVDSSVGQWGKADATFQGWGVQISDRPTYDPGSDERAVYEIVFLESFARWGEAALDEDMGETTANEAAATISGSHRQWGAAPNHQKHVPATITVKDRFRVGSCLKAGDIVLWLWDEQSDVYYVIAPQETGRVKVRDEDPCDFLEDQMENETLFDAGVTQKPIQTSDTTVFTDVFNYSLPNTLGDNWKIRDYVDWTVVNEYSAQDQVLVHIGANNVEWCLIEKKTVITDVRVESTTNKIVVDEMDVFVIKPQNFVTRTIHQGTECP